MTTFMKEPIVFKDSFDPFLIFLNDDFVLKPNV